ncbi:endo-alpha-N-acetylgalactosaminidase family protein [Erysipelothrix urinaevulpis]|uniref:endo-alpha-N-acetylgalactosaminidase family protein n=1 Tax=Erysipelothrix urinaevulpis TaxID=2683717 RepID=UPI0013589BAE|nr:endo-alpha-N-acetylgalactosaminidase family protein [Erysipelothrix urinaevulpis]
MRGKISKVAISLVMILSLVIMNPGNSLFASSSEWKSTSKVPGVVSEEIVGNERYWKLSSVPNKHDNKYNAAIFSPVDEWIETSRNVNRVFEYVSNGDPSSMRFGVNIFYTDDDNRIFVGHDAGGWFWQHKLEGQGNYYRGKRVPSPAAGSKNTLEYSLKDNKFLAWITGEDGVKHQLFDEMIDANRIDQLFEKSNKTVLRLAGFGAQTTSISVKANNQENIPEIDPGFERPEIDKYDDYQLLLDFENDYDPTLELRAVSGEIKRSIVDHGNSKALKIDFGKTGQQVLTFTKTALLDDFEMSFDVEIDEAVKHFGPALRVGGINNFVTASKGETSQEYFGSFSGSKGQGTSEVTKLDSPIESGMQRWKVILLGDTLTLFINDQKIFENTMKNMQTGFGEFGFMKEGGEGSVLIDNVSVQRITPDKPEGPNNEGSDFDTLTNESMTVTIDKSFPRIKDYTLKSGKTLEGQPTKIDTVKINDINLKPEVTYKKVNNQLAEYTLRLKDGQNINATIKSTVSIENQTLTYEMIEVINHNEDQSSNDKIIRTIEIPNHSLVSVKSSEKDANIMGSVVSTNTTVSGDTLTAVDKKLRSFNKNYMYAFVSNEDISAGVYSNSQYSSGGGRGDFVRLNAQVKEYTDFNSMGIQSSPWIYHRDVKYDDKTTVERPIVKVALTEDLNNDQMVDWQDGAIAFREIMYSPIGAEDVKDYVAYRIAMNFGSHAQNPFLMTLDGIKKVNLHTDGLGQSVLLKGYGSEGHDSGHLNYADIGTRIGGIEEFQYLLDESKQYGASIGIHVNASETYPESKYFEEDRLMKKADGSYSYGWNWIDQGINIDASYDLANGRRQRFEDLRNLITGENLGWIYVDVWGNGQSGDNNAWASHQLAKEIQDQGWRLGGEWGYAFEPDSTFQHWAADLTYGGYALKGFNSNVMRFIFNHQRDAWIADFPAYSGAAEYPLLGGYNMKDFEGWQGRNDYNGYIVNLFEHNVPSKFIQHFTVNKWIEGTPVDMKSPDGKSFKWTPEMQVDLVNEQGQKLVIQRKSNDYKNERDLYRSRTITLDGRLVLDNDKYLIPWNWDENGNELAFADQKLYHFNKEGGQSTWTLPSEWKNSSVKVYQLTETGNKELKDVDVINQTITLNAKKDTAYVIYQGAKEKKVATYGVGSHIIDPGFNSQDLKAWDITGGTAEIVKSEASNDMLAISNNDKTVTLTQTLTDLQPGEKYVAYVGVDNRSDSKARIDLKIGDEVISNYTQRSIAKNYIKAYAHNTKAGTVDNSSYFQNLFVHFTAPKKGNVELSLVKEKGEGTSYFDDIRITKNAGTLLQDDGSYTQDFEDNAQGIYPFVIGDVEGVTDNRTHLSEKNAPYTQRGWNNKKINDVIDGNWSVKTNGLVQRNKLVYQTIPQNIRFEENQDYIIRFEYEAGSDGTYGLVMGHGEYTGQETVIPLSKTVDKEGPQVYEFTLKGHADGQSWFGIKSTSKAPDLQGTDNGPANFGGYKDFVLDNLSVKKVEPVVLTDENGFEVSGHHSILNDHDELIVTDNLDKKLELEKDDETLDLDVFTIDIRRDGESIEIPENTALNLSIPTRKTSGISRFFKALTKTQDPVVKSVSFLNHRDELIDLEFEVIDGKIITTLTELGNVVVNYEQEEIVAVDRSNLEALVKELEALDFDLYTQDSVESLKEGIKTAKSVLNDENASQELIDQTYDQLLAFKNDLVVKDEVKPVDPVDPVEPVDPTDPTKPIDKTEEGKLPATGLSSSTSLYLVGAGLILIGLVIKRKRKIKV